MPSNYRRLALLAFVLLSCAAAAEPEAWKPATSPRIERLKTQIEAHNPEAVTQFWNEIKAQGAPLIEAIPGDSDHVLLTFVYRAQSPVKGVALYAMLTVVTNPAQGDLVRLLDSDVWFKTYWIRRDIRVSYSLGATASDGPVDRNSMQPDPLNPRKTPSLIHIGYSILELPAAPPQPWLTLAPGIPRGIIVEEQVASKILKTDRRARIYTPAGYDAKRSEPYPILICFDGRAYSQPENIPTPIILDNLIAAKKIPPMMAVFIEQSPQPQRNIELSNNQPFLDFVADELLPRVREKWRATADPAKTIVCGSSAGGLASLFFAFRRPGVFGNVLAQSAALWPGAVREDPDHEWLAKQYQSSAKLPIRIVQQVGILETGTTPLNGPSILSSNRRLRDVLAAKGYVHHYHEIAGAHEALSWRGGISEGLIELMGLR